MPQNRSLLLNGLALTLRSYPAILWTYVFNLGLSALFLLRTHAQLSSVLDTSLANQSVISGFDLSTVLNALEKIGEGHPGGTSSNYFGVPLYLILYFLLVPGTLFCYQTSAPARLSTLLQSGILHFWRFVRITLISLIVFGVVLGPLLAIQNKWSSHVDENVVGRAAVLQDLAGLILLGLVAAVLRVYFDLVEVYTVQLGLQVRSDGRPDRRVRRTLLPALRTLRRNFGRMYLTFVLLTLLGLSAVIITARVAMHSLAQPRVWPMFLLAQLGLFFMLFTRFWQRGAETVLARNAPLPDAVVSSDLPGIPYPAATTPVAPPHATPIAPEPDPLPNPEPPSPSLPGPDGGIFNPPLRPGHEV